LKGLAGAGTGVDDPSGDRRPYDGFMRLAAELIGTRLVKTEDTKTVKVYTGTDENGQPNNPEDRPYSYDTVTEESVILVLADEHLMYILHEISETSCRL